MNFYEILFSIGITSTHQVKWSIHVKQYIFPFDGVYGPNIYRWIILKLLPGSSNDFKFQMCALRRIIIFFFEIMRVLDHSLISRIIIFQIKLHVTYFTDDLISGWWSHAFCEKHCSEVVVAYTVGYLELKYHTRLLLQRVVNIS